jgi:transcription elongation factor GreA
MSLERILVTPQGLEKLRERLRGVKSVERPKNVRDIEEARAHGDLSENAEYHAAKERQGLLDAELRMLEDKIARAQVVDVAGTSGDKVVFGATVELRNVGTEEEATYRIVGTDEADLKAGTISYESPLARALIGKRVGDEVQVRTPAGLRTYEIADVGMR